VHGYLPSDNIGHRPMHAYLYGKCQW